MSDGVRTKPPIDLRLLQQVIYKHALIFFMLLVLGSLFIAVSAFLLLTYWQSSRIFYNLMPISLGVLFLTSGLFLIFFAAKSTISSMSYYYHNGLLKHHGVNLSAKITHKECHETVVDIDKVDRYLHIDELELSVYFEFQFDGRLWQCADLITNQQLFNSLAEGQTLPIRILPWMPEQASIRQRALLNQLKRNNLITDENSSRIGKPLAEYDEI